MRHFFLFVCTLLLLAACGTRGPLVMPPQSGVDHSSQPAEPAR